MKLNISNIVELWEEELRERRKKINCKVGMTVIYAEGFNKGSEIYVRNKKRKCDEFNISVDTKIYGERYCNEATERSLIRDIKEDITKHMIPTIIQQPFPKLDRKTLSNLVPYDLDVDGFSEVQQGKCLKGDLNGYIPATVKGVLKILESNIDNLAGKTIAILNRSELIGKPLGAICTNMGLHTMIFNSNMSEERLKELTSEFDIIITGCGKRAIFDSTWFKKAQLIIDCSMTPKEGMKGVGDLDADDFYENRKDVIVSSGFGQTGPLTILGLIDNVLKAYEISSTSSILDERSRLYIGNVNLRHNDYLFNQ